MFGQKHSVYYTNFTNWRSFITVLSFCVLLIYFLGQDFSQSRIREVRIMYEHPALVWFLLVLFILYVPVCAKEIIYKRPIISFNERGLCLERLSKDIIPWSNIRSFSVRKRTRTRGAAVEVVLQNTEQYRKSFFKSLLNKVAYGRTIAFPLTGLDMKPQPLMAMLLTYLEVHRDKEVEAKPNAVFGKKPKYRSDLSRA